MKVKGDPIFSFEPTQDYNFSGLWNLGIIVRKMSKYEEQYKTNKEIWEMFAKMKDYLCEECKAKPYYFSLTENSTDSDYQGYCETNRRSKQATTNMLTYNGDAMKTGNFLCGMDYILSQRLHSALLGWCVGKPNIVFEYQFGKAMDCMETIGMQNWVIRTDQFDLETFKRMFNKLVENRDLLITKSHNNINHLKNLQNKFTRRCLKLVE